MGTSAQELDLVQALEQAEPAIKQRFGGRLKGISHRFDSDDLYQHVCVRAYQGYERCRATSEAELSRWIMTIAANTMRSQVSKNLAGKRSVRREESSDNLSVITDGQPESGSTEHGEEVRRLLLIIDRLPRNQQRVVRMRFLEQREYREISKELGLTVETARQMVCHAVRKARRESQQPNLPGFGTEL